MKKYRVYFLINLLFVFVFLNVWDYFIDRTLLNAMAMGLVMFGPSILLWLWGNLKGVVLITLISIFEFVVMLVLLAESAQLSGVGWGPKSVFWVPYLIGAAFNLFAGLSIYFKHREKLGLA